MASLADPEARHVLLGAVAGSWADADLEACLAWVGMLHRQPDREAAWSSIARVAAAREPRRAMELCEKLQHDELTLACLRDWAQTAPRDAAEWSDRQLEGPGRTAAMLEIVAVWARAEPAAAADFTASSVDEEGLDRAVVSVIAQAGARDVGMLRDWVQSFPEGPLKQLARAELTRVTRLLPSAPASLPGEDDEQRSPVAVPDP